MYFVELIKNINFISEHEEYFKYLSEDVDVSDSDENEMLTQEEIRDKRLYRPIA